MAPHKCVALYSGAWISASNLTLHQSNINKVEHISLENDALYNQEPH